MKEDLPRLGVWAVLAFDCGEGDAVEFSFPFEDEDEVEHLARRPCRQSRARSSFFTCWESSMPACTTESSAVPRLSICLESFKFMNSLPASRLQTRRAIE